MRFARASRLLLLACPLLGAAADDAKPTSPFGVGSCHVNNRTAQDNARWVPQMEAIGLREYRAAQTLWGAVEPEAGRWRWDVLDAQMAYLKEHRFSFGGILLGNPRWNSLDKPGSLPVRNLAGWSRYVSAVVTHAKGSIQDWEVWNEPPNFTGKDQTPADYAKLVVAAHDAAKAADPSCRIGLAAKSAHINYLERVIQAGGQGHYDYITLHPYEVLDGVAEGKGTEPLFMNIVPAVRQMLAAQDPAKVGVPVVFTELGVDAKKGLEVQAGALVKAYTMGIAQGVSCIHWFEGRDGDSGPMGLIDAQGAPRPAYAAMQRLIEHLGPRPGYLGWVLLEGRHYGFAFQGARGPVLVAWSRPKATGRLDFPAPTRVVDALTGETRTTLSFAPALVLDPPASLLTQAAANKGKPLDWGGDFTTAKSVSLRYADGRPEPRGLHPLSGDAVAAAVAAYGGSARAGGVPGGNVFAVDPGFLSYSTQPIEITVVVRRNEANLNAGFKLVYESTSGLKTAKGGWYTVPDNRQWHVMRWRIDDAQFVNYWGYNFALESDGPKFSDYSLQSVTVTKLDR
jgi:hypothetical protein